MIDVVGLPVALAAARLREDGCAVSFLEARSRKGSGGTDERVIRQTRLPDGTVELSIASFVELGEGTAPEQER